MLKSAFPALSQGSRSRGLASATVVGVGVLMFASLANAAPVESEYPFEGTWVRADRACTAATVHVRTYTDKDVTSTSGRCSIRRVASGAGAFELFEECRRNDRAMNVTETIRMTSPDSMTLRRQIVRLKIPRVLRFNRCTAALPGPGRPPAH